ncbi:MAG: hypothetical protein QOI06_2542 [Nocardioidaceae bacterium]|jgi:hypothetical protein|nr:hypothetical protein [Nocardioidaceae bacterium]
MAPAVSEDGHHAPVLSIPIYRAEIAGFPVQPSATDAKAMVPAEIFGEVSEAASAQGPCSACSR